MLLNSKTSKKGLVNEKEWLGSSLLGSHQSGKRIMDKISAGYFRVCGWAAILILLTIIVFVFYKGLSPFISDGYSFVSFITGSEWVPSSGKYGILPMILASIYGTAGALLVGVPVGIMTAVFITEIAPAKISNIMISAVELLAGIPSVLFGIFALGLIVPGIQNTFQLPKGQSLLAVILVLAMMMLPTVISVSVTSIKAVPQSFKEASLALGATKIETIFKVTLPACKSGILTAVGLGMGRAVGETMAVILVAGNSPVVPGSITDSVRPLTTNIAIEMGYAFGIHERMLFATGVVLFTFILILNLGLSRISKKVKN